MSWGDVMAIIMINGHEGIERYIGSVYSNKMKLNATRVHEVRFLSLIHNTCHDSNYEWL